MDQVLTYSVRAGDAGRDEEGVVGKRKKETQDTAARRGSEADLQNSPERLPSGGCCGSAALLDDIQASAPNFSAADTFICVRCDVFTCGLSATVRPNYKAAERLEVVTGSTLMQECGRILWR